jgi:hypothetical protein
MKPEVSRDEGSEVCRCGCVLAKHYVNFVPGEPSCSKCRSCRGFVGTGRVDYTQLRSGAGEQQSPRSGPQGGGVISVGEPVGSLTSDKIKLERITVPNGPWVWRLVVVEEGGSRAGALLTTVDLQSLRDLFSRAIVLEQGGR